MTIREQAFQSKPLTPFIIDAHTHITPYYKLGWHQKADMTSLEATLRIYDKMGVNCCVTAPHAIIDSMTVYANELAQAAAKEYPGRFYGYISVAPFEGLETLKSNLAHFGKDPAFVGLKFLGGYNGDYSDPIYQYAADFANEVSAPILCHTWGNSPSLEVMRDIAEKRPNLAIISAHQGGGRKEMTDKAVPIVNALPNFYLEICGSLWNEYGMEDLVHMVGADRVIFGTDMINLDWRFDFGRLVFAPIDDEDMIKVLSGNYLYLTEKSQMGKIKTT